MADDRPLIVSDSMNDVRVAGNGAIEALGVHAYLGVPIHDDDRNVLGSVCVLDHQPREWSEHDLEVLQDLAEAVEVELRLRVITASLTKRLSEEQQQLALEQAMARAASGANSLRATAEALIAHGAAAIGAASMSLALIDDDQLVFHHGPDESTDVTRGLTRAAVTLATNALGSSERFETEQDHARTLKGLVLPPLLPSTETIDIAAAYLAPNRGQRVGGDVYDAVISDDGAIGLHVADAVGHDLLAARTSVLLRHAVAMLILDGASPAEVLRSMHRYIAVAVDRRFATGSVLLIEPTESCMQSCRPIPTSRATIESNSDCAAATPWSTRSRPSEQSACRNDPDNPQRTSESRTPRSPHQRCPASHKPVSRSWARRHHVVSDIALVQLPGVG